MSPRLAPSPAFLVRGAVALGALGAFAVALGDRFLRHLRLRAALTNAAHLTAGSAIVGWLYGRLGGVTGLAALSGENLVPLAAMLVLLPVVINGSFYLELALDRTLAWVDARLTARWEAIVYLASAALAPGGFGIAHTQLPPGAVAMLAVLLAGTSLGSIYVLRM